MRTEDIKSPLSQLDPREKLNPEQLLKDLRGALLRANEAGFYTRLLLNLNTRYCRWDNQSEDGRKWKKDERKLKPGDTPEVFPFPGASDARVRKVDEIIRERVGFTQAAYDRAEMRIGPRDLKVDEDLVEQSARWGMVANYYIEDNERELRRQARRWSDLAETYGHGVLFNGWKVTSQQDRRTISSEQLMQLVGAVAVQLARQAAEAAGRQLTPDEEGMALRGAMLQLERMIQDEGQRGALEQALMRFDPQMTPSEARRVATGLKRTGEAVYYVPTVRQAGPVTRALTPFVDVFYPPETVTLREALWIAMPEWVSDVELRERVVSDGYDKAWVDAVIDKGAGLCFDWSTEVAMAQFDWVASGGSVGKALAASLKRTESRMWQIMHVYYRATTKSGVPALYHTVLFGAVNDQAGLHECCEHAHGQYPFVERMAQPERDCLLDCEGVGEISFTYQQEIKVQRDMRVDFASLTIQPPCFVPLNHVGGSMDFRPRKQIPIRQTGGMGKPEFVKVPGDARGSQEVEDTTAKSLDKLWFRGPEVDPEVKLTMRQNLVSDFLADLKAARKMMWENIQQFASQEVKAGVVGGVPVSLETTREQIQGATSLTMYFDVGDLDPGLVEKKAKLFKEVVAPLDRKGLLPTEEVMKVVLAGVAPGWARLLQRDPNKVAEDERKDEEEILSRMLNGIQSPYVPGKDHQLRLQVIMEALGRTTEKGQPTRVRQILETDADVQELVKRRIQFHEFQIKQYTENPDIGRLGVEPVEYREAGALPMGGGQG
jgi:hypothetical protein